MSRGGGGGGGGGRGGVQRLLMFQKIQMFKFWEEKVYSGKKEEPLDFWRRFTRLDCPHSCVSVCFGSKLFIKNKIQIIPVDIYLWSCLDAGLSAVVCVTVVRRSKQQQHLRISQSSCWRSSECRRILNTEWFWKSCFLSAACRTFMSVQWNFKYCSTLGKSNPDMCT